MKALIARPPRLLPLVIVAVTLLLLLRLADLALRNDLSSVTPARAQEAPRIQEAPRTGAAAPDPANPLDRMFQRVDPITTGSTPTSLPPAAVPANPRPAGQRVDVPGAAGPIPPPGERSQTTTDSSSETQLLQRLQERREEIEKRAREVDTREQLLAATERRIEQRLDELKALEARIQANERQRDEADKARVKALVTMYEAMRAKDAARVFDRLDMPVLIEIVREMNPRKMADVLAAMNPEAAEKLTIELARRQANPAANPAPAAPGELPRIEGRPRS
jgi:flagellar motility protein MotE (MotC chaperone)